jgi:mono/diheme cytochrome c family protein
MKSLLRILGWALVTVVGIAIVGYALASWVTHDRYNHQWTAHDASFPIPFPLTEAEIAALGAQRIAQGAPADDPLAGIDPQAVALERAVARGKQMLASRVGCPVCHRPDFGGGPVVDEPIVGRWIAPNITTGKGSVTIGYTASDWDHAVRHGLRRGGFTSTMPSLDFVNLSDRELSDIVACIRSLPPVDRDPGKVELGPMFTIMLALDKGSLAAFSVDHMKPHPVDPPPPAANAEFGEHLVQVCRGCHGPNLSGGKLQGDPNMPVVGNLTPHETGLKGWTEADFMRALREGKRPDGSAISPYMPWNAYANMSDTEIQAIWAYLQTLAPVAKGQR